MAKLLKIDVFTDVVCPWCLVGSARLDKAIAAVMAHKPDLVLATGDLTENGDPASYERLREAFAAISCPVLATVGNHDLRDNFRAAFPRTPVNEGFVQYVVEDWPLRLVVLDTLEEGRHGGAFCEARAAWLEVWSLGRSRMGHSLNTNRTSGLASTTSM